MTGRFRAIAATIAAGFTLAALFAPLPVPGPAPTRAPEPVASVAGAPLPPPGPGPTRPPAPPAQQQRTFMSMGNSLSFQPAGGVSDSYRGEFTRLLNGAGQPHTWVVQAVPGSKCSYWAEHAADVLDQYDPDVLFLECGTNDTPSDDTEADYRTILNAATNRGIQVVVALVGIPDMRSPTNTVRPWIDDWLDATDQIILDVLQDYPGVRVADVRRVPATLEWLQPDGVHWLDRTNRAVAWLLYMAARTLYGWPAVTEPCGLSGSRPQDPEPVPDVDYVMCTH